MQAACRTKASLSCNDGAPVLHAIASIKHIARCNGPRETMTYYVKTLQRQAHQSGGCLASKHAVVLRSYPIAEEVQCQQRSKHSTCKGYFCPRRSSPAHVDYVRQLRIGTRVNVFTRSMSCVGKNTNMEGASHAITNHARHDAMSLTDPSIGPTEIH